MAISGHSRNVSHTNKYPNGYPSAREFRALAFFALYDSENWNEGFETVLDGLLTECSKI